jgi:maltooligosyltrehalose trehalohydrolase
MTQHKPLDKPLPLPWPSAFDAPLGPGWQPTFGAQPLADGSARFRVWAPRAQSVAVHLPERGTAVPMAPLGAGCFEAVVPGVPAGTAYGYCLDGGALLPDPASRHQPAGVHAPSAVVDPAAFAWTDAAWRGLPLEALVYYELHMGTFTPEGTFAAAIARLPHLRELGVTALNVMPVAAFPGTHNWGYDGVGLYAPHAGYGGPDGLKALVDAAHAAGLAVILDVVYNHLGPEGNYLHAYGPYFSGRYHTPWGDALNYDDADCEPVRRFFIDNALHWITEYHLDGLRLDAVHGIFDFGARHILAELGAACHAQARRLGRQVSIIAESDLNDVRVITPETSGGWGLDAQWSDDFHHAAYALLTGERGGYLADFGGVGQLARALTHGYVFAGDYSTYRRRRHGNSAAGVAGARLVVCIQNHDQVANASRGRRLGTLAGAARQRLAAALLLCAPGQPLLFMGEEWGEPAPFHYFTSHTDPDLARAVTEGRRREQAGFLGDAPFADPQHPDTVAASRLNWDLPGQTPHAAMLAWYRALLRLRREQPALHNGDMARARVSWDAAAGWLVLQRHDEHGPAARLICNVSAQAQAVPVDEAGGPWQLAVWSGDAAFGGEGAQAPPEAWPGEAAAAGGQSQHTIPLGPWETALYLQGEAR